MKKISAKINIIITTDNPYKTLELLRKNDIILKKSVIKDNSIAATIFSSCLSDIKEICKEQYPNNTVEIAKEKNSLFSYFTSKKVLLLAFLFIITIAICYIFTLRISFVEIDCDDLELQNKIYAILEEENLSEGDIITASKINNAEKEILYKISELAWISIHTENSGIKIYTRLKSTKPEMHDTTYPCNIIADSDMKIIDAVVYRGKLVAPVGSVIRKGDTIISGMYKTSLGTTALRHADGIITAEYEKEVVFKQSKIDIINKNNGNKFSNLYLDLFSINIPLLNFENNFLDYSETEKIYRPVIFEKAIPVSITKNTYEEKSQYLEIYSNLGAENELEKQMVNYEKIFSNSIILDKEIEKEFNDNEVIYKVTYTLLGTVGRQQDILLY